MNVGTIVEAPMLKVRLVRARAAGCAGGAARTARAGRLRRGTVLGEIDEYFVEQLTPGDTFVFAGEVLRFEGLRETEASVTRTASQIR